MNQETSFTERIVDGEELLYHGFIFDVVRKTVLLPDGKTAGRDIVVHKGGAAIVPVDSEGCVTLVRQYRPAMDTYMLEIPAGKRDSWDEDYLDCAKRELSEETGCTAVSWRLLSKPASSPGFVTEQLAVFLAMGLTDGSMHLDEQEFLNVVRMPLEEACARVLSGEITDAKTVCGLMLARHVLTGGQNG